jgi:alkyl hydroperoxide reductase subunit AhpC
MASLHLGDTAPDFTAPTTEGEVSFLDWKGDSWAVFFSHPADYTPVCTTELGRVGQLSDEWDRRHTKVIALSVDSVQDHSSWKPDVEEVARTTIGFPMIADPDKKVAELYDMIHPGEGDTSSVRSVFIPALHQRHFSLNPSKLGERRTTGPRQGSLPRTRSPETHVAQARLLGSPPVPPPESVVSSCPFHPSWSANVSTSRVRAPSSPGCARRRSR